jgi:hypothetical protein
MAIQNLKDTFMPYGRFKEINGNYAQSKTDYAERVKEKQVALRTEKAKEEKGSGKLSEPQDVYISSEKSGKEPVGLYRIGQDENGSRKIFFEDPDKVDRADGKEEPKAEKADGKKPKIDGDSQGKPAEVCVGNTDKVDREIEKLKEKKRELEQQIRSVSGDITPSGYPSMASGNKVERKIQELEKKLAQVEQELSQKDNDTYRKQHVEFSRMA